METGDSKPEETPLDGSEEYEEGDFLNGILADEGLHQTDDQEYTEDSEEPEKDNE
jgi:hypothetical protein